MENLIGLSWENKQTNKIIYGFFKKNVYYLPIFLCVCLFT